MDTSAVSSSVNASRGFITPCASPAAATTSGDGVSPASTISRSGLPPGSDADTVIACMRAGAQEFLTQPLKRTEFRDAMQRLEQSSRRSATTEPAGSQVELGRRATSADLHQATLDAGLAQLAQGALHHLAAVFTAATEQAGHFGQGAPTYRNRWIRTAALDAEMRRQQEKIELIASENIVSQAVLDAQGSILTNKYAEGYPGRRYYGGCEYVDIAESLAIERACKLFNCSFANVQPHSGSNANAGVFLGLLKLGVLLVDHESPKEVKFPTDDRHLLWIEQLQVLRDCHRGTLHIACGDIRVIPQERRMIPEDVTDTDKEVPSPGVPKLEIDIVIA